MLKQRAQAVRVREAIKTRIGTLHDAFIKFDYDQNGLLSPGEIYGALEYLNVPDLTPNDVLFFVRFISSKGHLTYANFMELLAPGAVADDEAAAAEAGGGRWRRRLRSAGSSAACRPRAKRSSRRCSRRRAARRRPSS